MADILYKTPPPHRTHHDPLFDISPAVFAFDLALVKRIYHNRITAYDKAAEKYIVGPGHKNERESLSRALAGLEELSEITDAAHYCPESIAATFANAMGDHVYDRFTSVHCEECNADYDTRDVAKTKWMVDNGDGSGSAGWRLACPKQHVLYASITSVAD